MPLDAQRTRQYLKAFEFRPLLSEEMGWERYASTIQASVDSLTFDLTGIAEKRGLIAFLCSSSDGRIPDYATRRKIEAQVTKTAFEHIIIYTDAGRTTQIWQWVKREPGKPAACREHTYRPEQNGEALIQKLQAIVFSLEEEESLTTVSVAGRVRVAFDVERITKRFYDRFKSEHAQFLKFIEGIPDKEIQRWYASVMINRLMFIYFIQKKGFLDGDTNYLRTRLHQSKQRGLDIFYSAFLSPLFFEGFAKKESERSASANKLLGKVPYLNGGLFLRHQIEEKHVDTLEIRDSAFEKLFDFFDGYQWQLDERPLRQDNEINPDVLGYIFEKYINQKEMGAYYTKEDITEYIGKNTIVPFLFDKAREKCRIAFEGDHSIWQLLQADPDRYIYDAVKKGVDLELPNQIAAGVDDVSKRTGWNKQAPEEFALPTETWREVVLRRKQYEEVRMKLASGQIENINDLITCNLDIRQFAQDIIEGCEGPDLLNAFWHATEKVTVLDPACGSGAFLFAALNILEPLYEACLDRMEVFLEEWGEKGKKLHPNYHKLFRDIRTRLEQHPNRRYFILKSIIINNLFGVDIMEEATEICKLRLFLKLVAQIERDEQIEPLPDIDFNIRAGNTLVGYATYDDVKRAIGGKLDFDDAMATIEEKAQDVDRLFALFRQQQTELGGEVTTNDKNELRKRLKVLEDELNTNLSGQYGVKERVRGAYESWFLSHKPFHWFVEFHSIILSGGFDVLLGNPPYVEYHKVRKQYSVLDYRTLQCGNLYTLLLEQAGRLVRQSGRSGFIVPLSLVCTARTNQLRELLRENQLWISCFDMRPGSLFEGVSQRLSIALSHHSGNSESIICTSGYRRWSSDERSFLIENTRYVVSENDKSMTAAIPKVSTEREKALLGKILGRPLGEFTDDHSSPIYVHRIVRYFAKALDFVPLFIDATGSKGRSEDYKEFRFRTTERASILALLNSSLFYWFWRTHSDGFHCGYGDVFMMPYRPIADPTIKKDLETAATRLMASLNRDSLEKTISTKAGTIRYQEFHPKLSKAITDEIDFIFARHYEFTPEELDFIINYDIKYRMGLGGEQESEE